MMSKRSNHLVRSATKINTWHKLRRLEIPSKKGRPFSNHNYHIFNADLQNPATVIIGYAKQTRPNKAETAVHGGLIPARMI